MEQIRRISDGTYVLTVITNDEDGLPITARAPSVIIRDGAGAQIDGIPAPVASDGRITVNVPAGKLPNLDTYRCTWRGEQGEWSTEVELAGGYLFEIAELRASDPASLGDSVRHPPWLVRAARTAAEQRFERVANLAFVPRGRRVRVIGTGAARLRVPNNEVRRVISVSVAGVPLTASEIDLLTIHEWGGIDRAGGASWPDGSIIELHYEHGLDSPPNPVRQACMLLAKEYLVRKALGARATLESTEVGSFRISLANSEGSTGIPEVDAVAAPGAFGRRPPRVW